MNKRTKEIIKRVAVGIVAVLFTFSVMLTPYTIQAATDVTVTLTNTLNSVLSSQAVIGGITVNAVDASYVRIYDSPATNLTYSSDTGYTNFTWAVTSYTNTYTDFAGVSTELVSNALTWTTNSIVGFTNTYPVIWEGSVPAATTLQIPLNTAHVVNFGLAITNSLPVTITTTYATAR